MSSQNKLYRVICGASVLAQDVSEIFVSEIVRSDLPLDEDGFTDLKKSFLHAPDVFICGSPSGSSNVESISGFNWDLM